MKSCKTYSQYSTKINLEVYKLGRIDLHTAHRLLSLCTAVPTSVGYPDPEPDPQDLHVFGPPGYGSISQRYGSGSIPFLINVLSGLKQ